VFMNGLPTIWYSQRIFSDTRLNPSPFRCTERQSMCVSFRGHSTVNQLGLVVPGHRGSVTSTLMSNGNERTEPSRNPASDNNRWYS
jgi:hypothetical protein